MDWLCPTSRLWCLISRSVISAQRGCLWTPLRLSFLLTQTVRKQDLHGWIILVCFPGSSWIPEPVQKRNVRHSRTQSGMWVDLLRHGNEISAQEAVLDGSGMGLSLQLELQFNQLGWNSIDGKPWYSLSWLFFFFLQQLLWVFWWTDFKTSQN